MTAWTISSLQQHRDGLLASVADLRRKVAEQEVTLLDDLQNYAPMDIARALETARAKIAEVDGAVAWADLALNQMRIEQLAAEQRAELVAVEGLRAQAATTAATQVAAARTAFTAAAAALRKALDAEAAEGRHLRHIDRLRVALGEKEPGRILAPSVVANELASNPAWAAVLGPRA